MIFWTLLKVKLKTGKVKKIKRRDEMQDFLFITEQKKDELIKNLSEKLKLSVNFKKNNIF